MRHLAQLSVLAVFGLSLFLLADSRADEAAPAPQLFEADANPQTKPAAPAEEKPAAPRFVLTLTRQSGVPGNPIARHAIPDYEDIYINPQPVPEPGFTTSRPIPKRGSKRSTKPATSRETLRVTCTDVKMSGTGATGKSVKYTIECAGPISLDNGRTNIRASKLQYTDGVLTLDDVTIHQIGTPAGLLEEMRTKQLTIKFPLESLRIQDVDTFQSRKPERDAPSPDTEFDSFSAH